MIVDGTPIVLFRDSRQQPVALLDQCPHRAAPLSEGHVDVSGAIVCPYHGWRFDRYGHATLPDRPSHARCHVEAFDVVERYGLCWVSRSNASSRVPEFVWPGYTQAAAFSLRFEAPLEPLLDNFSEDEHFPYVHQVFGWDDAGAAKVDFEWERHSDHTTIHYAGPQRWTPWNWTMGVRTGDTFSSDFVVRFDPVHVVYATRWTRQGTGRHGAVSNRIAVFLVPETEHATTLHGLLFTQIHNPLLRPFGPLLRPFAGWQLKREFGFDGRLCERIGAATPTLKGRPLSRYDGPLVHGRTLLRTHYFGRDDDVAAQNPSMAVSDITNRPSDDGSSKASSQSRK